MSTIKLTLSPEELEIIDNYAAKQGTTRAQALRIRAFDSRTYSPKDYEQLILKARRVADIPRGQVERIVNAVFIEIMEPGVSEATQL